MRAPSLLPCSIALIFSACIWSCSKDPHPGNSDHPPREPFKTEKGSPLSPAVTKMIGASGGTLTSNDGKLSITVPAGAVTANTNFSIQPITLTIPSSEGDTAYRLLPEGTAFSKPVTITYHYNAADTKGTTADLLFGTYQTSDGHWASVPSALNKNNNTITLTSQHFSDWAVISMLKLKVEKPLLTSLEETDIEIFGIVPADDDDVLLAPLSQDDRMDGWVESIEDWDVIDGGGIVGVANEQPDIATYSPFNPVTHGAKAHVSVTIKGNMKIDDPTLPANMREIKQVILIAEISFLNDTYMIGSFNGQDISSGNAEAMAANGHIFINATTSNDTSVMSYLLHVVAESPGSFPCGLLLNAGNAEVTVGGEVNQQPIAFITQYIACGPPSHIEYSGASVKIDSWGPVGSYVTGSFSGPVYPQAATSCSPNSKGLDIKFRAIRTI